jgi:hypothetical protein
MTQMDNFELQLTALCALVIRGDFEEVAKAPELLRKALARTNCGPFEGRSRRCLLPLDVTNACAKAWLAGNIDFLRHVIVFPGVHRWGNLRDDLLRQLLQQEELGVLKAWPIARERLSLHVTDAEWEGAKEEPERAKYLREMLPADVKAGFRLK